MELQTETKEWGTIVRASITDDKTVYFSGFDKGQAEKRAITFRALHYRCKDGCEIRRNAIPTEVACMGKPAIAAYLFAVHEEGPGDIADRLEISPATVNQYMSNFRRDPKSLYNYPHDQDK